MEKRLQKQHYSFSKNQNHADQEIKEVILDSSVKIKRKNQIIPVHSETPQQHASSSSLGLEKEGSTFIKSSGMYFQDNFYDKIENTVSTKSTMTSITKPQTVECCQCTVKACDFCFKISIKQAKEKKSKHEKKKEKGQQKEQLKKEEKEKKKQKIKEKLVQLADQQNECQQQQEN